MTLNARRPLVSPSEKRLECGLISVLFNFVAKKFRQHDRRHRQTCATGHTAGMQWFRDGAPPIANDRKQSPVRLHYVYFFRVYFIFSMVLPATRVKFRQDGNRRWDDKCPILNHDVCQVCLACSNRSRLNPGARVPKAIRATAP